MKRRLILVAMLAVCCPARAELSTEDKEVLAKTLVAEAGWYPRADHAAILHVLDRRSHLPELGGRSIASMARSYAAMWRVKEPRTVHLKRVFALDWATVPSWLRNLIDAFEQGTVADPCRGRAWHWGSYEDARRRVGWTTANCGATANVFFTTGGGEALRQPPPRPLVQIGRPERSFFTLSESEAAIYVTRKPQQDAPLSSLLLGLLIFSIGAMVTWFWGQAQPPRR